MLLLKIVLGLGLGGGLGALLGYYGQCSSGACPLTANPWRGALFGALIGVVIAFSFRPTRGADDVSATAGKMVNLTDEADFRRLVEESPGPTFVRFFSNWCGPCRQMVPGVRRLSEEFDGRVVFVEVNTDRFPALAGRLGVQGVPTSFVFRGGQRVETLVGYRDEGALRQLLDGYAPAARERSPEAPESRGAAAAL